MRSANALRTRALVGVGQPKMPPLVRGCRSGCLHYVVFGERNSARFFAALINPGVFPRGSRRNLLYIVSLELRRGRRRQNLRNGFITFQAAFRPRAAFVESLTNHKSRENCKGGNNSELRNFSVSLEICSAVKAAARSDPSEEHLVYIVTTHREVFVLFILGETF